MEPSQMISNANQFTGSYMMVSLVADGLNLAYWQEKNDKNGGDIEKPWYWVPYAFCFVSK